jgi:hypothetical protein
MERLRPTFLAIFAATILPHLFEVPFWVTAVLIACALLMAFVMRSWLPPMPSLMVNTASVICAGLLFMQFGSLLTPDAATPLLLMMAGLKLQEIRAPKDAITFLFVCTMAVMAYLLYSQTLFATLYMLCLVLAIAVGFITVQAPPNKVKEILKASPRLVLKDTLLALPIFLLFFFLFPRFSTGWGQTLDGGKAATGFSNTFNPGELTKLARSSDPAFRVTFHGHHPLIKDLYWRGLVFDKTDGWNWSRHQYRDVVDPTKAAKTNFDYDVTLEPKHRDALFVLQDTGEVTFLAGADGNRISRFSDNIFSSRWPNVNLVQYHGVTDASTTKVALDADDLEFYTRLPKEFSPKARDLTKELMQDKTTLQQKIMAVYSFYTKNNFQYSLSTPEMRSVDDFLFKKKTGFCEHYADSFALIMRAAGVPSRVVVGFQGGELNPYGHYWLVRDSNAHAWVELYDKESQTWLRADPTQAVAGNRIDLGSLSAGNRRENSFASAFYSAQMFWDSINNRYTQTIMSYDFNQQKNLMSFKGLALKRWQLLLATALAIFLSVFIIGVLIMRAKKAPDSLADRLFAKLERRLQKRGIIRLPNEGPLQFAHRAAGKLGEKSSAFRQLMELYILWAYRSQSPSDKDANWFRKALRSI